MELLVFVILLIGCACAGLKRYHSNAKITDSSRRAAGGPKFVLFGGSAPETFVDDKPRKLCYYDLNRNSFISTKTGERCRSRSGRDANGNFYTATFREYGAGMKGLIEVKYTDPQKWNDEVEITPETKREWSMLGIL